MPRRIPRHLPRAPVGPLRFAVTDLSPQRFEAVAKLGRAAYRVDATPAVTLLELPGGRTERFVGVDEAETAAAVDARRRHPLRPPTLTWKRAPRPASAPPQSTYYRAAVDLPLFGRGHFELEEDDPRHASLAWHGDPDDPYSYRFYSLGYREGTPKAVRALAGRVAGEAVKLAKKGEPLFRAYPVVPDDLQYLPATRRQVHVWRWWAGEYDDAFEVERRRRARKSVLQPVAPPGTPLISMSRLLAQMMARGVLSPTAVAQLPTTLSYAEHQVRNLSEYSFALAGRAPGAPRKARTGIVELVEYRDGAKAAVTSRGFVRGTDYHHAGEKILGVLPVDVAGAAPTPALAQMELLHP